MHSWREHPIVMSQTEMMACSRTVRSRLVFAYVGLLSEAERYLFDKRSLNADNGLQRGARQVSVANIAVVG